VSRIAVLDYGGSNLRSVAKAVEHVAPAGAGVLISDEPQVLSRAERLVFPGQGAIGQCMSALRERGLDETVRGFAGSGRPLLGICLGLQTLLAHSEEDGGVEGLGLVAGRVLRFTPDPPGTALAARRKIPHMGWNLLSERASHPVWAGIPETARFYFVHSYYVAPEAEAVIAARTEYGERFVSAIAWRSVFATQFHPEKSQQHGLRLLENFLHWQP